MGSSCSRFLQKAAETGGRGVDVSKCTIKANRKRESYECYLLEYLSLDRLLDIDGAEVRFTTCGSSLLSFSLFSFSFDLRSIYSLFCFLAERDIGGGGQRGSARRRRDST